MSVGPTELLLIVLVAFLLFGSRRLGDLGKGIGDGIRNFKRAISDSPTPARQEPKVETPTQPDGTSPNETSKATAPRLPVDAVRHDVPVKEAAPNESAPQETLRDESASNVPSRKS
ncbi:MAG: twin-arginine translocase TatA/TatE family subunit [Polyangiaceae bacterium]